MTLSFIALGTGDAFSAKRYGACLAVEHREGDTSRWLLIDCPHPIRKLLHEGSREVAPGLDVGSFDALVLTHLHADHASGLEGWGFFHRFALQKKATLLAHPSVARDLWTHLQPSMGWLLDARREPVAMTEEDYFDVRTFVDEIELGPFRIEARTTWHHIPTIALCIHAGGRCLGYSADTAFDPALFEWLAASDLLVHEANLGPAHTPYATLAALPADVRAKIRLIAFPDDFVPDAIEPLREGARVEV
ncbi:MAG: ribonuclease Z [Myxococcales bacterium]|nr:ribonuclease Z [Myxococcales bacterium]